MAQRGTFDADSAVGFCADCEGEPPRDCGRERRRIERKCGPSRSENRRFVAGRERYNARQRRKGRPGRQVQERNMTWKDNNCGAALVKLDSRNLTDRMNRLNEMADTMFDDLTGYAADLGITIAQERLERYGVATAGRVGFTGLCAAAGTVVGPAGTVAGGAICGAASAVLQVTSTIWNIFAGGRDIIRTGREINAMLDTITNVRNNAQAVLNAAEDRAALADIQRGLAEVMAAAAEADPCLKARKCYLVPYRTKSVQGPSSMNQRGPGGSGFFDGGFADLSDSRGCCPGQTGHHVVPAAFFGGCSAYTGPMHNRAPTVCAEGVNQTHGSHGQMHDEMDEILRREHGNGQPMSKAQAIDYAIESLRETVGEHCREDCLREQLERFYNDLPCEPTPVLSDGQEPGLGAEDDV